MFLKIYIILSLFSGIFVLPLLILVQLKYKKSVISKYILFFINFLVVLSTTGAFRIYDMSGLNMPTFVFLLFFLSFISINITLPLFINSFYKISFKRFYTIVSVVLTVLIFFTIGSYGHKGSEGVYAANILFTLTYGYSLVTSIIKYKKLGNKIEKRVGLAIIVLHTLFSPTFLLGYFQDALSYSEFLYFLIMNIVSIILLWRFLSFSNSGFDVQIDFIKSFNLTPREVEVVQLLKKGMSYKEISEELSISVATVKTHLNKIYKKTDTKSRFELSARFK